MKFVLDDSVTMRWFFGDGKQSDLAYAAIVLDRIMPLCLSLGHWKWRMSLPGRKQKIYALSPNNSRPISILRISFVPAPMSYNLASRNNRPVGYSLM